MDGGEGGILGERGEGEGRGVGGNEGKEVGGLKGDGRGEEREGA